jgi:hypothetical protein
MHVRLRAVTLFAVAVATYGCSDATSPNELFTEQTGGAVAARAQAEGDAALQQVARGVALAMNDAKARQAVRDAMRDSPWNEHKLVFQEFLGTEDGRVLADAAASGLGMTRTQFLARVAHLPSMDFYFVHGIQRRTWRGTPGVVVGATLNSDAGREYRFDSRGETVGAPRRAGAPEYPLAALIPAESKAARQSPQPKGKGDVIEAANDGQRAESYKWVEPDGTVLTANLADIRAGRDPRFTVRMSTSSATGGTRIDCITSTIRDGGYFAGNVELEVYAKFYGPDGGLLGTGVYKNHEFPEPEPDQSVVRCPAVPLIARVMPDNGTAKINVELWEDDCDCWGNDDDYYGARDFRWDDRGQNRDVGNDGNMIELDWNPIPASVVTSVSVQSVWVYAGDVSYSSATPIDQYGYRLPAQTVSNWWSGNAAIAGVDGSGTVVGYNAGSAQIYATIAGVTGSGTATVDPAPGSGCGSQLIC